MSLWLVMVVAGLITFGIRLSFIAAEGRVQLPGWFRGMLPFVPVATLAAIIAPDLAMPGGTFDVSLGNPRLLAGVVAAVIAALTRNVLLTIAVGFGVLLLIR